MTGAKDALGGNVLGTFLYAVSVVQAGCTELNDDTEAALIKL
jgi:hypothetical protein